MLGTQYLMCIVSIAFELAPRRLTTRDDAAGTDGGAGVDTHAHTVCNKPCNGIPTTRIGIGIGIGSRYTETSLV